MRGIIKAAKARDTKTWTSKSKKVKTDPKRLCCSPTAYKFYYTEDGVSHCKSTRIKESERSESKTLEERIAIKGVLIKTKTETAEVGTSRYETVKVKEGKRHQSRSAEKSVQTEAVTAEGGCSDFEKCYAGFVLCCIYLLMYYLGI